MTNLTVSKPDEYRAKLEYQLMWNITRKYNNFHNYLKVKINIEYEKRWVDPSSQIN